MNGIRDGLHFSMNTTDHALFPKDTRECLSIGLSCDEMATKSQVAFGYGRTDARRRMIPQTVSFDDVYS